MHKLLFISTLLLAILLIVSPVVAGLHETKRSFNELRARDATHHHSHKKAASAKNVTSGSRLTFYSGGQLAAPSCGGDTPHDHDLIAAAPTGSPAKCGNHVTIRYGGKEVTVRIVDTCEACPKNGFDLSKGAFSKLAELGVGVIDGAEFWIN